ncbi:hypothetical protein JHK82_013138 [Glycine max]|nr:hypothetical protein JHK87_013062 [Glycine soja]KAG5041032.1 hypothetical protein JHK85_013508 [Glycine max]KAG5058170.1 hypothetical protein JHK86_013166 [Glycine max]KAG5155169.1 hypothetical protein JHK82_013138 [Glycine max]
MHLVPKFEVLFHRFLDKAAIHRKSDVQPDSKPMETMQSYPTHRSRPNTLFHLHGNCSNHRGQKERSCKRQQQARCLPVKQPLPLSIFWLAFQYFIFGIADMLTYVGFLEFFYSEAPKGLKSTSTCFLWCSMALGYFLSSILVKIVNSVTKHITASGGWLTGNNINRNHLNLFYLFLSILSLINFFVYLFVSKRYKYRAQHPAVTGGNSEE